MARGCGLVYYEMQGDYDCTHGYTWGCEDCPIAITAQGEQPETAEMVQLE